MKIAQIGYLVFCLILAILILTHTITFLQSSSLFAVGLIAFGIIRRKENNTKGEKAK